jgi:CRISPR-associated protein Csd2
MSNPIEHRYDFVFFFDVENGNPNGDPDAGNMPRIDPETGTGIVSDVCIKRKVRNYVDLVHSDDVTDEQRWHIYVQEGAVLNDRNNEAYTTLGIKSEKGKLPKKDEERRAVTKFMCDNFYDIRTFGAVMTTGVNCGQVRGPVQLCFGQSVEPVVPSEMSITRMAVTRSEDADLGRTMGRKQYIPYGLYRMEGFVSAPLAKKSGFTVRDLDILCEAFMNMFECDRSAARGLMTSRKLVLFEHESELGNASSRSLFDAVGVKRTTAGVARKFSDYAITIDEAALPAHVTVRTFE